MNKKRMNEIKRVTALIQDAYDGDAWYGPSLKMALRDVSAEIAAARVIPGVHSIWEIILHITGWITAVRIRLKSNNIDLPQGGDWPVVDDITRSAWEASLAQLEQEHHLLINTIRRIPEKELSGLLGEERVRETGGGVSIYTALHGLLHHNIYHTGQISLMKKVIQKQSH